MVLCSCPAWQPSIYSLGFSGVVDIGPVPGVAIFLLHHLCFLSGEANILFFGPHVHDGGV